RGGGRRVVAPADAGPSYLPPGRGPADKADKTAPPRYGPYPVTRLAEDLPKSLGRIARAQNLLALATPPEEEQTRGQKGVDVEVALLRFRDPKDEDGETLRTTSRDKPVRVGDRLAVEVTNPGTAQGGVAILGIDSDYGIHDVCPRVGENADNQIKRMRTYTTRRWPPETPGTEHVVVIAVKARKVPVNFSSLSQPALV